MCVAENHCEHPLFLNMLRVVAAAGNNYVPPRWDYIRGVGLQECRKRIEKGLAPATKTWKETGVTIASDMIANTSGHALINIMCINNSGVVFSEAVDCRLEVKSGAYIAGILRPIIQKIGPATSPRCAWAAAATTPPPASSWCSSGRISRSSPVPPTRRTCGWRTSTRWSGRRMWSSERTTLLHSSASTSGRAPSCRVPSCTAGSRCSRCMRLGSQYIAVSRLCELRPVLMQMVVHGVLKDWVAREKRAIAEQFKGWVMDGAWWKRGGVFCEGHGGAVPGDEEDGFDSEGDDGSDVRPHAAAEGDEGVADSLKGLRREVLEEVEEGHVQEFAGGVLAYIKCEGSFGTEEAMTGREELKEGKGDMLAWWQYHGWEYADLADLARRRLSQPVSAASCERNWAVWDGVHTARRNGLGSEKPFHSLSSPYPLPSLGAPYSIPSLVASWPLPSLAAPYSLPSLAAPKSPHSVAAP
ncbi:unnamed protein product [Closterium sp. Naga37s-1]|nr:unnamed protein product [Closterium sp. Naga37s-1]